METQISTLYKSILHFKKDIDQKSNIIIMTTYLSNYNGDWKYDYHYLIDGKKGGIFYKHCEITRIN